MHTCLGRWKVDLWLTCISGGVKEAAVRHIQLDQDCWVAWLAQRHLHAMPLPTHINADLPPGPSSDLTGNSAAWSQHWEGGGSLPGLHLASSCAWGVRLQRQLSLRAPQPPR